MDREKKVMQVIRMAFIVFWVRGMEWVIEQVDKIEEELASGTNHLKQRNSNRRMFRAILFK